MSGQRDPQCPYPHIDCHYRNKDTQKVKGYSINVTESCDDDSQLNLIGHVDVKKASTSDVDFLRGCIEKSQDVFPDKIAYTHADGAYHSPDNQKYCKTMISTFTFMPYKVQKAGTSSIPPKMDYFLFLTQEPTILLNTRVLHTKTAPINGASKQKKVTATLPKKDIDGYLTRKQIDETPIETLQKRKNVEATIFQLGYHYSNAKTRYRGEIKHQMWANIRCLWVNFVRILKFKAILCKPGEFFGKFSIKSLFYTCLRSWAEPYFALKSFLKAILQTNLSGLENIRFSIS